uniref:YEATS domain-containing protein n=1 Tax=Photinus pyralis TaxID=7054 RepID=A0A1Y1M2X0_PHOPY
MSVRINFEIGHEAAIRAKCTQEGFTHDWVVFVRGCDGANIHHYVEKVVFYLHETFPRPRRVIKEPPYMVKESGYAGFTLPIEIYLRNKDEPKKITLTHDLHLQSDGAPISDVQTKKYVFNTPGEDFKFKLLQGGGMIVNSQEASADNRSTLDEKMLLISKPKLGGSDVVKKHKMKVEEPRNSFHELFGAPITKTSKTSVDAKAVVKNKNINISKSSTCEKDKSKNKHSPHKEKEKEKNREKDMKTREEKKREEKKERSKDREERKDKKEKREKSPKARSETPTKRTLSPSPLPKHKDKDDKKIEIPKDRKSDEREKLEKRLKKEKRDKEKERKDSKYKEREQKSIEQKENKSLSREKDKHKEPSPLPPKNGGKEKLFKEKDILKDCKDGKEELDKEDKIKAEKLEEKVKHKHKRKDKDKKEKEKLNEKTYKSEKKLEKSSNSKYTESSKELPKEEKSLFSSPKQTSSNDLKVQEKPKKPLGTLMAEFTDNNSSNSSISSHEDLFNEPPTVKHEPKKEPEMRPEPDNNTKLKREKVKKNKDKKMEKSSEKKRKRKSDNARLEEPLEKVAKEESSNSKESDAENCTQNEKQEDENYEDYMNILRDLQHKILTLQDNSELQRVVQLIAETGRFEVSAQTFDFDLCLLERSTITQLQNFFQSTS